MDPFTLALLGGSALASGGLSYMGSKQAAGAQQQAAQQSGMLGLLAQQQAAAQAQRMAEQGAAAGREFYGKGREDLLAQGKLGAETARDFYGQGVGFQEPYMGAGAGATNQLAQLFGQGGAYTQQPTYEQLQMDPGYAFRQQQGEQAMLNAARGGGLAGSGAALKAATRYGQEAGSQEYTNAYNRFMANRAQAVQGLQNLAGTGAGAAGTASQLAGSMGNALAGNQFNLGSNLGTMASNAGSTVAGAYTGAIPTMAALTSANPYGQAMENVGQARASGYVGGASALGQALQGPANAMLAYSMMDRFAPQNRTSTYNNWQNNALPLTPGFSYGFQGAPTTYGQ
jgi:hypothetical protein